MACAVAREPKNFPCHECDCLDGRQPHGGLWKIPEAGIVSDVCFRRLITPFSMQMLDLYRHYQNGLLPFAGGLYDQPAAYFRAMSVIDSWMKKSG